MMSSLGVFQCLKKKCSNKNPLSLIQTNASSHEKPFPNNWLLFTKAPLGHHDRHSIRSFKPPIFKTGVGPVFQNQHTQKACYDAATAKMAELTSQLRDERAKSVELRTQLQTEQLSHAKMRQVPDPLFRPPLPLPPPPPTPTPCCRCFHLFSPTVGGARGRGGAGERASKGAQRETA